MKKKRGTNCIEGFRCPKCGNFESFNVEVPRLINVQASGTDDCGGDTEWSDDSYCECDECGHEATVGYFTDEGAE